MSGGDGSYDPDNPNFDMEKAFARLRRLKWRYIFISICAGLAALIAVIQLVQDL
jgi:hypothetical protein